VYIYMSNREPRLTGRLIMTGRCPINAVGCPFDGVAAAAT